MENNNNNDNFENKSKYEESSGTEVLGDYNHWNVFTFKIYVNTAL